MPITAKTVIGVKAKLLKNMFIRAKSGHIPVDLQGDQQVYHVIFGNRKFSIRPPLQEGNFVFRNFGSRDMFHVLTTPSVPGSFQGLLTLPKNQMGRTDTFPQSPPLFKLLGIPRKSFSICWVSFSLLRTYFILT